MKSWSCWWGSGADFCSMPNEIPDQAVDRTSAKTPPDAATLCQAPQQINRDLERDQGIQRPQRRNINDALREAGALPVFFYPRSECHNFILP